MTFRTEDVGAALNQEASRCVPGTNCAQPILRRMGVESTVRPSLALYNTREEIDALVATLLRLQAGGDSTSCNRAERKYFFAFPLHLRSGSRYLP